MADQTKSDKDHVGKAIEITIRLVILVFIFGWSFLIISPFISLVMWGIILAVTAYPAFIRLEKILKGRTALASTLITLFFLTILVVPAWMLGDSLFEGVSRLREAYQDNQLVIPPPGEEVKDWPVIAKPLIEVWTLASQNLEAVMTKFAPQVKAGTAMVLSLLASTGMGILQFIASIIIAGVFLNYAKAAGATVRKIFGRLGGKQGENFAELSEVTIRNVVKGILGVAIIQSLMAGIGFFVAGIPLAGLWTLFCLILAIVQIGVGPIAVGVLIYAWTSTDTLTASLLTVWLIIVSISDNVLKPFLLGRGAPVPMLVVFLGSVGGFISSGFIGLFLGPVLLSLGYKLFLAWVDESKGAGEQTPGETIPNERADS